jgi:glycosyltransferase involved in cell wall biosynthesis
MNIIVDLRPLIGRKTSGVKVYIRNLLRHLLSIDKKNNYFFWINAYGDQSAILREFKSKNLKTIQTTIPNKVLNLMLVLFKRPYIDKFLGIKADIFFMPDMRPFSVTPRIKSICTVHDLSFKHYPKYFSLLTRLWHLFINPKYIFKRVNSLIAVSKFTKEDIIKTYNIKSDKISVIHEGHPEWENLKINKDEKVKTGRKYNLPPRYFLALFALEPRKNLERLMKAFIIFKKTDKSGIKLVIAGEKDKKIFSKINIIKSPHIMTIGFIDEKDKACLYHMSEAFVYPSVFEGFGLPLIEAISIKVPVITSNTSSMPEVCGHAALYFNPENISSITACLHQILKKDNQKKVLSFCEEQSKKFTWYLCAGKTLQLFESL